MSLHRLAEERSLAYHRVVADRIRNDPRLLDSVRARLHEWIGRGDRSSSYAAEWLRIVDLPVPELLEFLVDPGEHARELRQSTPFAGFLAPKERWRLWAEVRERYEGRNGSMGDGL